MFPVNDEKQLELTSTVDEHVKSSELFNHRLLQVEYLDVDCQIALGHHRLCGILFCDVLQLIEVSAHEHYSCAIVEVPECKSASDATRCACDQYALAQEVA